MLKGNIVALITPLNEDKTVDYIALKRILKFQKYHRINGVLLFGSTGQESLLSDEEKEKVYRISVNELGNDIPIIIGVIDNSTERIIKEINHFERNGAKYFLITTPYYVKGNEQSITNHVNKILDQTVSKIILYNIPSRTNLEFPIATVKQLSMNNKVIGIKDASNNISYLNKLAKICNKDFALYCGNDEYFPIYLSLGASGIFSVISNVIPLWNHKIIQLYEKQDVTKINKYYISASNFFESVSKDINPVAIQLYVSLKGLCKYQLKEPLYLISEELYDTYLFNLIEVEQICESIFLL